MKDLEKLKKEQEELKERLLKLIAFINSEEYFTLDEAEKSLLMSQRAGMEIYLNSLTQRIYGTRKLDVSSSMLPLLMMYKQERRGKERRSCRRLMKSTPFGGG